MSRSPDQNDLFYGATPIRQMPSLAKALNLPETALHDLAAQVPKLYRIAKQIRKTDGSLRITYDAHPSLKRIHRKIQQEMLTAVHFPQFLTGSLKGRDIKSNARVHLGAAILINEDVSGFFPSTTRAQVFDIWHNFFGFSPDVADCLATLTTYQGSLPQGAITSSYLANLAFWRDEPNLRDRLATQGIRYSRYVDDISLSSVTPLSFTKVQELISDVFGMMIARGYAPKRSKHTITTSSRRMSVTSLTVNDSLGLDSAGRRRLRAAVHRIEKYVALSGSLPEDFRSVLGKVIYARQFHPAFANALHARLLVLDSPKDR